MSGHLSVATGQFSDAGIKDSNDDACGITIPDEPTITNKGIAALIADGVSSAEGGKEASEACLHGFMTDYFSTPDSWTVKTSGRKVLGSLNRWLHSHANQQFGHAHAMLTTLSTLVIKSGTAHIFHVGDTRIYRLRDNDLECLTTDHRTWGSSEKSYLGRAMGAEVHIDIDYASYPVEVDDVFLLLTDGVHEFVSASDLKKMLIDHQESPEFAARTMVTRALEQGSKDNCSALIVKVEHLPMIDQNEFYEHLTELPFPPPLEPGMILDGYRITRELHASNRTQVYVAQDSTSGKNVIIKTPSVNYEDDPAYIDQFLHEEWVGRRINNPHVLKIVEPVGRRRFLYYITEYIEGKTLRQWMNENTLLPCNKIKEVIEQIASGLRAFHRLEMVHRDLKPENIMIDNNNCVVIIDFGSTKIAGVEEIATPYESNSILGTLDYSAPEYFLGQTGSNRSDIFSLGVITYELLSGKLPYGKALAENRLKRATYTSIKHYRPEVPAWFDSAMQKAVNLDAEKRYAMLSEYTHDISQANPAFLHKSYQPLMQRNPTLFWKTLSALQLVIILVLAYLLVS